MVHKRKHEEDGNDNAVSKRHRASMCPPSLPPAISEPQRSIEYGVIERVNLKNFMSHGRLEINFGPCVNFVIGRNGSGKSAVLTALIVGLGGKASVTNRGNAIKNFIKTGRPAAEVQIQLLNGGPDAYKPDVYGKSIIIERRITAEGSSGYKIKSSVGKVVSTKRDELDRICDQFNIQVDNPIAILNQDTSRNFLHSKSHSDKYKFFLKATQLEQMKMDYYTAKEAQATAAATMLEKERNLPELEKQVKHWEMKYKASSGIDERKKKLEAMKQQLAWAFVEAREKTVADLEKEAGIEQADVENTEAKLEKSKAEEEKRQQRQKVIKEELSKLGEEAERLEPEFTAAAQRKDQIRRELRDKQASFRKIEKDWGNVSKDRDETVARIEELRKSVQHDNAAQIKARADRLSAIAVQRSELEALRKTQEFELEQFHKAVEHASTKLNRLRQEEREVDQRIDQLRRNLANLQTATSNRLRRMGSWMPALVSAIEHANKQGQFHKKPRGPLGAVISVNDPSWALPVEVCIGPFLQAFCCHDHHDERTLERIISQHWPAGRPKPRTIVSPFLDRIHDVSSLRCRSQYPTVLDLLQVDDPVLMNCLIDQRGIENVIMIGDDDEANTVMLRNPPKNCAQAFTKNCRQIYASPNFRNYAPTGNKKTAEYLSADVQEQIKSTQEELLQAEREKATFKGQVHVLDTDMKANQKQERVKQNELNRSATTMAKLHAEAVELSNIEEPAVVDVATLEEEVSNYDAQLTALTERRQSARLAIQQLEQQVEQAQQELNGVSVRKEKLREQSDKHVKNMQTEEMHMERDKFHLKQHQKKLKDQEQTLAKLHTEIEKGKSQLQEEIEKASHICEERPARCRSVKELQSEIQQMQLRLNEEEKIRGKQEDIARHYVETKRAYQKIRRDINDCKITVEQLQRMIRARDDQYGNLLRSISVRANLYFMILLQMRNYTGSLNFEHETQNLIMNVQPNHTKGHEDLKSLSGGERSFSTVCFLLALWDVMETPFRVFDEFDVFMDMVNRQVSMELMVNAPSKAANKLRRQSIYMTPNDIMSMVQVSDEVKIFQMPEPDRDKREGQDAAEQTQG